MVGIVNLSLGTQLPVHNLSVGATATSSSSSITIPVAARVDDIAILFDRAAAVGAGIIAPAAVTPSGWTQAITSNIDQSTGSIRTTILYKLLVSGDPGTTITGMAALGSGTTSKIMAIYRPLNKASVLRYIPTAFNFGTIVNGTAVTNQTINATTLQNNNLALVLANYTTLSTAITSRGSTGPYTMTEVASTSTSHYMKYYVAPYSTNFSNNETISILCPVSSRIIMQSGILTIK